MAAYNSGESDESDAESVIEVPLNANDTNKYRNNVVEINSDADDSDSDSSSTVSDESADNYLKKIRKEIDKSIYIDKSDDEDDVNYDAKRKPKKREALRVKGELLLEDLPPIQDLHISVPAEECIELGHIQSIVDQLVLVAAKPNSVLLDLDTVLFLEQGQKVLGEIFDVLGQVSDPLYCIRFNSHEQIEEKGIKIGQLVYVAPKTEHTQLIVLANLMKNKGSDASWDHDIEPPPNFIDYSDDEQERSAKAMLKNKKRTHDSDEQDGDDDNDDAISIASSIQSNYSYRPRGRGGFRGAGRGGQFNPPMRMGTYQRQPQYTSSWHSNFNYAPRFRMPPHMPPPPPMNQYAHRIPPPNTHMYSHDATPPAVGLIPAAPFNPYALPPPLIQPPQMPNQFLMNPYGIPPPNVHEQCYNSPPPPPPGAQ